MIVCTSSGYDTYAAALQTLFHRGASWDMMSAWCLFHVCSGAFIARAITHERARIRRREWPESLSEQRCMQGLHVLLSANEHVEPHDHAPWPDVHFETSTTSVTAHARATRRRLYGWLRRLRLRAARQGLLARLQRKEDLADKIMASVGW